MMMNSFGAIPVTHGTPGCFPGSSNISSLVSRAVSCIRAAVTRVKVRVEGFLEQPQHYIPLALLCSFVYAIRFAGGMASVCMQGSLHPDEDIHLLGVFLGSTGSMVGGRPNDLIEGGIEGNHP